MKKHFLLLMMAFMSITAWATDLTDGGTLLAPSPYYGQAPEAVEVHFSGVTGALTLGTHYTFDGYFSDAACGTAVTVDDIKAANAGTKFYAKVTGKGVYEGSLTASFEVKRMPLILTGTAGKKTYGTTADGDIFKDITKVTVTGGTDDIKATFAGKFAFTRATGENAGNKVISATISDTNLSKNYTVESSGITSDGTTQAYYVIKPKDFTKGDEGTVAITVTSNLIYNGTAQKATVEVKDKALNTTLVENTDYTLTWINNTAASTTSAPAKVKITGKGNYNATATLEEEWTIAPATLLVTPSAKKVYDGTVTVPSKTEADNGIYALSYSYQGFVDSKKASDVTVGSSVSTVTTPSKNVGQHEYKVTTNNFSLTNYKFQPEAGVFEITQLPITFTAKNDTIAYGDEETYALTDAWKATAVDADEANLEKAIKITRAETAETSGANAGKYKLTPAFKTDAEIDAYVEAQTYTGTAEEIANAKKLAKANIKTARDNYKGTFVAGYATITGAVLTIALNESFADYKGLKKVYDGKNISITLDKENGVKISGKKNASDVIDLTGLKLEVVDNDTKEGTATVGTYQLKLSGATAENYTINYIPSQYEITKKDLKVKLAKQTFVVNQTVTLNTAAYTIDEENGLAATDKASDVFKVQFNATATGKMSGGKFTSVQAEFDGIEIVNCGTTTSKWANYTVTAVGGKVEAVAATAVNLDDSKDLTTVLNEDKTGATVTFSARAINAEQWNVIVLPFDVSVKNLSNALGYAVIDVFDTNASDGNIHFKLKVAGTISANTPMLVYPNGEINNMNSIVIPSVTVKKVTDNVSVADASGNKFVGTYKATGIYGEKFRYMSSGKWFDAAKYTEASPANIKPLRGYLDLTGNTAAARALIFIDEPDGTTTAIKAISGDVISRNAEGWYTIGGMKLEGAPTQKGIYIQNGKKVVVK